MSHNSYHSFSNLDIIIHNNKINFAVFKWNLKKLVLVVNK